MNRSSAPRSRLAQLAMPNAREALRQGAEVAAGLRDVASVLGGNVSGANIVTHTKTEAGEAQGPVGEVKTYQKPC